MKRTVHFFWFTDWPRRSAVLCFAVLVYLFTAPTWAECDYSNYQFDDQVSAHWTCNADSVAVLFYPPQWGGSAWWYWGLEDICNQNRPLFRALNAKWLLYNLPRIGWIEQGQDIVILGVREWSPTCHAPYRARAHGAPARVELAYPFFYEESPIQRAGTMVHEGRHGQDVWHIEDGACRRGGGCDNWFYDTPQPANAVQVQFLAHYILFAPAHLITADLRERAFQEANSILLEGFRVGSGQRVDRYSGLVPACHPFCHPPPGSCGALGMCGRPGHCYLCD